MGVARAVALSDEGENKTLADFNLKQNLGFAEEIFLRCPHFRILIGCVVSLKLNAVEIIWIVILFYLARKIYGESKFIISSTSACLNIISQIAEILVYSDLI